MWQLLKKHPSQPWVNIMTSHVLDIESKAFAQYAAKPQRKVACREQHSIASHETHGNAQEHAKGQHCIT